MASAVVYKKVGSVSDVEARQVLTDLFADNGYLQDSLAIYACSRSPYFDYDDNVLRVFIVSALDGRIDLEAAGVEDYPEFSFGGEAVAIVLHSLSPISGAASYIIWRRRKFQQLRRLFKVFSFGVDRGDRVQPATSRQLKSAARLTGRY
eukprot:scpid83761/ scgid5844/ 